MLESKAIDGWKERRTILAWNREQLETEGKLASEIVARWGMVAGIPDGEDRAGRCKLRLLTPEELVHRACETAQLLMEQCRTREWTHVTPSMKAADEIEEGK